MTLRRSPLLTTLAVTLLAAMLLAALGPFGTYLNGGFAQRLGYWSMTSLIGLVLYGGMVLGLAHYRITAWAFLLGASLLVSLPETWLSHALALRLWPDLARYGPSMLLWYAQTVMMGGVWTLLLPRLLLSTSKPGHVQPLAPPPDQERTSPDPFAGQIIALQMEDHYVRIHGEQGSHMVLMPLGQAIAALDASKGLRTHRSWWVARDAVAEIKGTPRAMKLVLSNGLEAPVARSAVARLRAEGSINPV